MNVVQREMLRAVVGWVAVGSNDWKGAMRRMNDKYKQLLTVLMARTTRTNRDVTVLSVSCISTHSGMNIMSGSLLV